MTAGIVSWPARFVVHPRKITDYLLDPLSDDGISKCAYLEGYGFRRSNASELSTALILHARIDNFAGIKVSPWELKFLFDGTLAAPNGGEASLLTVWQVKGGSDGRADFVTSRPSKRMGLQAAIT